MGANFIQVAPDSTGKSLQTWMNNLGGTNVHAEAVVPVDTNGNFLSVFPVSGPMTNAEFRAAVVNVNGSGFTQPISAATLPLPTGAATAAAQTNGGQKVQVVDPLNASNVAGITNGALNVYLSRIIVDAGTNLNTAGLALTAAQTNGGQKTQIVDPSNASNAAGLTNLALDVNLKTPATLPISAASLPLPTGAATAAAQTNGGQKTLVVDPTNASNVAGVTNGALNVYLPSIIVNAGSNLNTSGLALSAAQTNGGQKVQLVDPANISNTIGTNSGALNVNLEKLHGVAISQAAAGTPLVGITGFSAGQLDAITDGGHAAPTSGLSVGTEVSSTPGSFSDNTFVPLQSDLAGRVYTNSASEYAVGGAITGNVAGLMGVNVSGISRSVAGSKVGLTTNHAAFVDIELVKGGQPTASGVLDVSDTLLDGTSSFSLKYFAQRISSQKNTFPTNSTCYISTIKIQVASGPSASSLTIRDQSGSGNMTVLALPNLPNVALTTGPLFGQYLENYIKPIKATNGININTSGSPDCNVFITYWQ